MIRFGIIAETDASKGRARVEFPDFVSGWMPIIFQGSNQYTPATGDRVAVIPGADIDGGAIIGTIYTDATPTNGDIADADRTGAVFSDGSKVYFDAATSTLIVDSAGKVTVTATQEITATVGQSEFKATPAGLSLTAGGQSLKSILSDLVTENIAETHTTPAGPSGPPLNAVNYALLITRLNLLLES